MQKLRFKILILTVLVFFVSCIHKKEKKEPLSNFEDLKNEAVELAVDYANKQLTGIRTTDTKNGIITINDGQKRISIDKSEVFTGLINDDENEDAIVSLTSYFQNNLGNPEHLILINIDSHLTLVRIVEVDMKILMLKDRIITAEVRTKPRNSPLYDCPVCKEVTDFQFKDGDLVKME